ncbi:M23 family metallopeptidase [Magnetospirillum sp. UT-4]|uniref:M23 family metallopeptidase n=1 Tax=Magnetospirillum sp. UT-4 TaxID=2681467 RepID=UPI001574D83E|nr:M23 family metallopeptidase [Magnetospirillum sp. UT-4]
MTALMAGWGVVATLGWLGSGASEAEASPSCAGLRRELDDVRSALTRSEALLKTLGQKLRRVASGHIRAVETALAGTGLDIDRLAGGTAPGAAGGPFIADGSLPSEVLRWERLRRSVRSLPVAAPLADYEIASGFGHRIDPFNRRRALHSGIDLMAPLKAPVLATAPGRVVYAGRNGGYGRMVEIEHAPGIRTRYAHLATIRVRVGQRIAVGKPIGTLGSSGRSTAPHLHYEVVVDGLPRDPERFMAAGRMLVRRR